MRTAAAFGGPGAKGPPGRQTKARGLGPKAPVPALSGRFAPRLLYRLQRNRPLGGTYATPSMGETSVYTLRKWETGQIT